MLANDEAKQKGVPVWKREKHVYWSDHPEVKCARAAISEAYDLLTVTHSPENRKRVIEAKYHLYQLYERLKAEELKAKVKKVEEAHTEKAYGESWKLINDITGCRSTQSGQVQEATEAERYQLGLNILANY